MYEKLSLFFDNPKFSKFSKYTIFLLLIISTALSIRFYFFPIDVPLTSDALYYFLYSSDIYHLGQLPKDWSPVNNGWPIFVSLFFSVLNNNDIQTLMTTQRILSVFISVIISIPVYYLCKKFVQRKYAIIGVVFVAFEPRLIINSFLGITDPLYLLLITSGLVLFLSSNKKQVYFSFILISLSTIVRGEGLVLFLVLSIIFLIRYRNEKYKIFFKYFIIFGIFMLIILPVSFYRIDARGDDGMFMTIFSGGSKLSSDLINNDYVNNSKNNNIISGLEIYVKYLIWIMIPNFIIFIPLGLLLIFRNRNFEKNTIIAFSIIMSIPALYAYTSNALDTRYLYMFFPIFSVLSVLSIEKIIGKLNKSNIIIVVIISAMIVSSILFYDYKKIDYEHEKESFEIMNNISSMVTSTNVLDQKTGYFQTIQTIEQWPRIHTEMGLRLDEAYNIKTIPTNDFNSIEDYIIKSKKKGLTHIIIDDKEERPVFLKEIFIKESDYTYLEKIYDSKNDGFVYHIKVFKINYNLFDKKN